MTVILTLITVATVSLGNLRLSTTNDLRVYFSDDNPQLGALEELEEKYRENDSLLFLVVPEVNIFKAEQLQLVADLTEAAWKIPYAQRVSSLANYQYTYSDGETIVTEELLNSNTPLTPERIQRLETIAQQEPGLSEFLVARDGSLAAISVLVSLPDESQTATETVVESGRALVERFAPESGTRLMLAGSVTNSVILSEAVEADIVGLVGLSFGVIVLLMLVLLRSLFCTLVVLVVIAFSVVATMGAFGWMGYTLSPTAGFVPSVVMTIAVADCVHVLVSYFVELGNGRSKHESIRESLRINLSPVFVTTVTTAIGVLSLNLSDSPPYRDLGNMVALGVLIAFILSISFLPAALAILPIPNRGAASGQRNNMDRLANWVIHRQRQLLLVGTILLFGIGGMATQNDLTERWHEYFNDSFEIRRAVDLFDENVGGIHRLYYDLETNTEDGIVDPVYQNTLNRLESWLREQPLVTGVAGIHTTVKTLNKAFNYNDQDFYVTPDSSAAVAQYLLLHELSLPLGASLDNVMDQDRSASRLTVAVSKTDSEQLLRLDQAVVEWLSTEQQVIEPRGATGLDMVFAHITHRNIRGLIGGTLLALIGISMLLMLVLGSVRLGIISLLPNLAPAALAYGLWALGVGYIDLALSVVICMSLGIVVDDTVHFLSKYLRARRERKLNAADGIRHAFRTVGMALFTTSVILVAGFALLLASDFVPTQATGSLLALTLALALAVDFLLLPPLLLAADRRWPMEKRVTAG